MASLHGNKYDQSVPHKTMYIYAQLSCRNNMEQNDWMTQTSSASASLTTCNSSNRLIAISGRPFDFEGVGKSAEWSRFEALPSVQNDAEEWDHDFDLNSGLDMETMGEWGRCN